MVAINDIFLSACDAENLCGRGRGGRCVENTGRQAKKRRGLSERRVKTPGRITRDPVGVPDLTQAKNMVSGQASGGINLYGNVESGPVGAVDADSLTSLAQYQRCVGNCGFDFYMYIAGVTQVKSRALPLCLIAYLRCVHECKPPSPCKPCSMVPGTICVLSFGCLRGPQRAQGTTVAFLGKVVQNIHCRGSFETAGNTDTANARRLTRGAPVSGGGRS